MSTEPTATYLVFLPFVVACFVLALGLTFYFWKRNGTTQDNKADFPIRLIGSTLLITTGSIFWIGMHNFQNYFTIIEKIQVNMKAWHLHNQFLEIDHEMIENAAQYVFTGEAKRKESYLRDTSDAHKAIEKYRTMFPDDDGNDTSDLIEKGLRERRRITHEAFTLYESGDQDKADDLLISSDYIKARFEYNRGVQSFYNSVLTRLNDNLMIIARNIYGNIYLVLAVIAILVILWAFTLRGLRWWHNELIVSRQKEKKQRVFLNTLLDHMPLSIFAKDVKDDYKLVLINKEAETVFCTPAEKLLGTTDYDHWAREEADFFRETDELVMAEGKVTEIEAEPVTTPRGTFIAHTLKVPIYDDEGRPSLLLGILEDVTEKIKFQQDLRNAKEEAERANQTKSEFLANMSHELRTPLNSIIGMTRMICDDTDIDTENRSMANVVYRSAINLLEIVNDILDISKIEAGSMMLENIGFDIKTVISNVIDSMTPVASSKGVVLRYYYTNPDIPYLKGDPLRINRIFTNLISNAIKYSHAEITRDSITPGHVDVTVDVRPLGSGRLDVTCRVEDTGIGIDPDKIDMIFQKFTQADASITRKYGGTGLGLTITKELVEMMGGTIGVDSTMGKGSCFWFTIPFHTSESIDTTPAERAAYESAEHFGKIPPRPAAELKVLVAEDHALNQDFIIRLLSRMGFEDIDTVENGIEALKLYQEKAYDLIFMDCHMPDKNGYDVTQDIRAAESSTGRHTPIIALTADAMKGTEEKCLKAGMDYYITKPINADELRKILRQWVCFPVSEEPSPPPEDNGSVPADFGLLKQYVRSTGDMKKFYDIFVTQSDESIKIMNDHVTDTDGTTWVEAAHKFKGGAGIIGAGKLHALCAEAESMRDIEAVERQKILDKITAEYGNVRDYLHHLVVTSMTKH